MGMRVAVEYKVPVLCWVDIEEGEIISVTEHTELLEPTGTLIDADGNEMADNPGAFEVAQQIADSTEWPAWSRNY